MKLILLVPSLIFCLNLSSQTMPTINEAIVSNSSSPDFLIQTSLMEMRNSMISSSINEFQVAIGVYGGSGTGNGIFWGSSDILPSTTGAYNFQSEPFPYSSVVHPDIVTDSKYGRSYMVHTNNLGELWMETRSPITPTVANPYYNYSSGMATINHDIIFTNTGPISNPQIDIFDKDFAIVSFESNNQIYAFIYVLSTSLNMQLNPTITNVSGSLNSPGSIYSNHATTCTQGGIPSAPSQKLVNFTFLESISNNNIIHLATANIFGAGTTAFLNFSIAPIILYTTNNSIESVRISSPSLSGAFVSGTPNNPTYVNSTDCSIVFLEKNSINNNYYIKNFTRSGTSPFPVSPTTINVSTNGSKNPDISYSSNHKIDIIWSETNPFGNYGPSLEAVISQKLNYDGTLFLGQAVINKWPGNNQLAGISGRYAYKSNELLYAYHNSQTGNIGVKINYGQSPQFKTDEKANTISSSNTDKVLQKLTIRSEPSGHTTISSTLEQIKSIRIYDISGKLVFDNSYNSKEIQLFKDVLSLPNGIYIIVVKTINTQLKERIIL